MAGRNASVSVKITGEADFDGARREAKEAIDKIERAADDIVLSPELDSSEIQRALDLARQLDGLTAELTVDTDLSEVLEAEKLAKSLRGFQARVDLSVEGRQELADALGLADQMDRIRQVKVEVQGRQDLERAGQIADDLERRRTVTLDVNDSALSDLESELSAAGERGANGIEDALGGLDLGNMQGTIQDGITGALAGAGAIGLAAGLLGELIGDDLAAGVKDGFNRASEGILTQAQFGLTDAELVEIGAASGAAWNRGFGESMSELRDTGAILKAELSGIDEGLDLSTAIPAAETLSQLWGVDIPESARLARNMVAQGLAPDTITAYRQMADAARNYQGDQDEVFSTVDELTSMFARMGIDGARGFSIVGDAAKTGQIEVGQMSELFEEFTGQITDGSARDSIEALGLSFEDAQTRFANGQGAEVMADINERLLAMKDSAQQNVIAADLYGESWAKVADPEVVLELLAQADAVGEVGTALDDGTAAVERATTEWDKAKRTLQGLAGVASTEGATAFNQFAGGIEQVVDGFGLWGDASDNASGKLEAFGDLVGGITLGPLGVLADDLIGGAAGWLGFGDGAEKAAGQVEKAGERGGSAGRRFDEAADGADSLAEGLGFAAESADELSAELEGLFNFNADQLMRDIADAGDRLAETLKNGGAAAVGLGGSIDISTEAGRDLQSQMEGLNGTLVDAVVAYNNQEISAEQLASAQSSVESQFNRVTGAADLTGQEVDGLRGKYLALPADVTTNLRAIDNATAVVKNLQNALANLHDKTITVTTRNAIIAATAATANARARGGWTDGLTLVGEEGPELIDVKGRAFVYTASETQSILSNRGGDLGGGTPVGAGRSGSFIENATFIVDKGVDLWQQARLAEQVYSYR